jgi:hypothetical protein
MGSWKLPFSRRAMLYVDGFNLHHAILETGRRDLLWLDLIGLGRQVRGATERLAGVTWVSAHRPQRRERMLALFAYERALRARGVRCLMGHFVMHADHCHACGHLWTSSTEKQSDVNLALAVASDAAADRFDTAYLVTTDGDHAATARFVRESFPEKRIVSVAPPGRGHNKQVVEWCDARAAIDIPMLEQAILPERLRVGRRGWVERPLAWSPPEPEPPPGPPPAPPVGAKRGHLRLVVSN